MTGELNSPQALNGEGSSVSLLIGGFSSTLIGRAGDPFANISSNTSLISQTTDYLEVDPSKTFKIA